MKFKIEYYDELTSTNDYAKEAQAGTVIVARHQTNGKGRLGRSWQMAPSQAIAMSACLCPDINPQKASMLTLVAGLALADALGDDVMIKWPNDAVIAGKKIAGILTEMAMSGNNIRYVVIGIGINVNMTDFPDDICNKATSLRLERGSEYALEPIIETYWECFEKRYETFLQTQDMSELMAEYNERLVNVGKRVYILENEKVVSEGIALGINKIGNLLVKKDDESITEVYSGEVSVRGIYGYT